jgi:hypothetical protein
MVYTILLVVITYWLSHRAILGGGTTRRSHAASLNKPEKKSYTGWEIPLVSPQLASIVEKEFRYVMRNAQIRMMTLMPLILIVIRLMNRRSFDQSGIEKGGGRIASDFLAYGNGLMATGGVLYVFLILAGISCNQFAFEGAGMRTLILSPVNRKTILLGKNLAVTTVALIFSAGLLAINELVFGDLTLSALLFPALSFIVLAPLMSVIGNSLSVRFPKRMNFGKRLNVSGVVGLLMIPIILLLSLPPLAAVAAGYIAQDLLVEYVTLALLAALSIGFYVMMISAQGENLQRRELDLLEAVTDPGSD